ncbi:hypothetical protein [Burkholderia vietnamiensis]|uniref:hypothetical protein n=1 Tax=Burkholderia vietnamiensis TaxID=60552 RepID=UPI001CF25E65|nr:hypothetical protein [Burkholderia vietnamiensis]MCA7983802.1 hypothetical protein [Burkholderia vietnamiensis]
MKRFFMLPPRRQTLHHYRTNLGEQVIATKIAYGKFQNLQIFGQGAFETFAKIKVMSVLGRMSLSEFVNKTSRDLNRLWDEIYAASTPQDFQRVAAVDPALLDCAVPEARAMIASRVIDLSTQSEIQAAIPDAVPQAKETVLSLLENVTARPELDNAIQHMTSDGAKASLDAVMAELETFFKLGATGSAQSVENVADADGSAATSLRSIALAGDFRGWYDAFSSTLMEELPRGHVCIRPRQLPMKPRMAWPIMRSMHLRDGARTTRMKRDDEKTILDDSLLRRGAARFCRGGLRIERLAADYAAHSIRDAIARRGEKDAPRNAAVRVGGRSA